MIRFARYAYIARRCSDELRQRAALNTLGASFRQLRVPIHRDIDLLLAPIEMSCRPNECCDRRGLTAYVAAAQPPTRVRPYLLAWPKPTSFVATPCLVGAQRQDQTIRFISRDRPPQRFRAPEAWSYLSRRSANPQRTRSIPMRQFSISDCQYAILDPRREKSSTYVTLRRMVRDRLVPWQQGPRHKSETRVFVEDDASSGASTGLRIADPGD
jgi:hypothetical protein